MATNENGLKHFMNGLRTLRPHPDESALRYYAGELRKWTLTEVQWHNALSQVLAEEEFYPPLATIYPYLKRVKSQAGARVAKTFSDKNGYRWLIWTNDPNAPLPDFAVVPDDDRSLAAPRIHIVS